MFTRFGFVANSSSSVVRFIKAIKLLYLPMSWYICFSGLQTFCLQTLACVNRTCFAACSLSLFPLDHWSQPHFHAVPPSATLAPSAGREGCSSAQPRAEGLLPTSLLEGLQLTVFLYCVPVCFTTAHIRVFLLYIFTLISVRSTGL